jgi:hypothetical protein
LQKTCKKSKKLAKFSHGPKTGQKTKGYKKMMMDITLPLLGSFTVWAGLAPLIIGWVFLAALFVAIHLDNKKDEN